MLKTIETKVALEEYAFELLRKHLQKSHVDLGSFLSVLIHAKIAEMVSLGVIGDVSQKSAERLIRELLTLKVSRVEEPQPRVEELVEIDADVHPAFYQAQMRVMGTAE